MPRGASATPIAFGVVDAGEGADVRVERGVVGEQLLDLLERVEDLDQARVVVVEGAEHGAAVELAELGPFLRGARRADAVGDVEAGQRSDAVDAVGIAERLVVAAS